MLHRMRTGVQYNRIRGVGSAGFEPAISVGLDSITMQGFRARIPLPDNRLRLFLPPMAH